MKSRTLSRPARKAWLLAHVIASVGWLGAGAANLALSASLLGSPGDAQGSARAAYWAVDQIDLWIVIPAAFSALISGLVLSIGTAWGLFKHWWVLLKFVLTVAVISFSSLGLGVWIERGLAHPQAPDRNGQEVAIVVGASGNIVALLVMTGLSIYKPRGQVRLRRRRKQVS